jgi:hypothetical protein
MFALWWKIKECRANRHELCLSAAPKHGKCETKLLTGSFAGM